MTTRTSPGCARACRPGILAAGRSLRSLQSPSEPTEPLPEDSHSDSDAVQALPPDDTEEKLAQSSTQAELEAEEVTRWRRAGPHSHSRARATGRRKCGRCRSYRPCRTGCARRRAVLVAQGRADGAAGPPQLPILGCFIEKQSPRWTGPPMNDLRALTAASRSILKPWQRRFVAVHDYNLHYCKTKVRAHSNAHDARTHASGRAGGRGQRCRSVVHPRRSGQGKQGQPDSLHPSGIARGAARAY
jgi:hypothetical protein